MSYYFLLTDKSAITCDLQLLAELEAGDLGDHESAAGITIVESDARREAENEKNPIVFSQGSTGTQTHFHGPHYRSKGT